MRKLFYRYTGAVSQMADPMGDASEHENFNSHRPSHRIILTFIALLSSFD
ncbi:MAG: hypothetical protein GTN76_16585 [Candidatus Aenigmarchaeota archaeon]|nr:hypothetical protein [Candidatus Aenigmarchaeota archaeon]